MSRVQQFLLCTLVLVATTLTTMSTAFVIAPVSSLSLSLSSRTHVSYSTTTTTTTKSGTSSTQRGGVVVSAAGGGDDNGDSELIAKRIIVTGDVMGGYYRACVKNEASRFRRLVGTMSPPDDSKEAEIYVEGKKKMVDGFVRWVKRGNVGLSQVTSVKDVIDEEPTGLYDAFYIKMLEPETSTDGPN